MRDRVVAFARDPGASSEMTCPRRWSRIDVVLIVLLPLLTLPLTLAAPEPVDPCPGVLRYQVNAYVGDPTGCDSCADARATQWANCARRSAFEMVRAKSGVAEKLDALEKSLDQLVDWVGRLAVLQSGGRRDMTHEVVRYRARVTSALLEIAKLHASGEPLDMSPRLRGDMDRVRKTTLDRIESPKPSDFAMGGAEGMKDVQKKWFEIATEYGPVFQKVTSNYDRPTHIVLRLLEEANRKLLASDEAMKRAVAEADSLKDAGSPRR